MSQQLINRNHDLKRLRDDGYEVEIRANHLLIHSVPYANAERGIAYGTLVSVLEMAGDITVKPKDHIVWFIGAHPCNKDGTEILQIKHSSQTQQLANSITVNHSFSNKPASGYNDYHHKMTRYVEIIEAPAKSINAQVTARTFKPIESPEEDSVFNYMDTASSRAGIAAISDKLKMSRVAIIGLGGTGSYVLDLIAKTPVGEIHLFDGDKFLQHNAFRSPSAASIEELESQPNKAAYFKALYSKMRKNIEAHEFYIDETNIGELQGFDFVFICVDKGSVKKRIIEYLWASDTPFVDVGMDVLVVEETNELLGVCRVTTSSKTLKDHVANRISFSDGDDDDLYAKNIQIADLNALNAALAVIKWKKLCGFYQDLEKEHHSTYSTNANLLTSDERL